MQTISSNLRKEVIRRLVDEFHPETIYLFGSHAWGKPNDGSDMDLLVIISRSRQKPIQRAVRAAGCACAVLKRLWMFLSKPARNSNDILL